MTILSIHLHILIGMETSIPTNGSGTNNAPHPPAPRTARNKLSNLHRLARLSASGSFAVPSTHVLSGGHFECALTNARQRDTGSVLLETLAAADATRYREALLLHPLPPKTRTVLAAIQAELSQYEPGGALCVRSCFDLEDMPARSFAGVFDTVHSVVGYEMLLRAVQIVFASALSQRAIEEIRAAGMEYLPQMSVAIQPMIGGEGWLGGVAHTQCPDLAPYPLMSLSVSESAAAVTSGVLIPEEYLVNRDNLDHQGIRTIVQAQPGTHTRERFSLNDQQVRRICRTMIEVEEDFESPVEIEWLLDPQQRLHLLQARPAEFEVLQCQPIPQGEVTGAPLCTGIPVGNGRVTARVRRVESLGEALHTPAGHIIVAHNTDPDWTPVVRRAAALVTAIGARTSHVSRSAREARVLAVVGAGEAVANLVDGEIVTVVCAEGVHGACYAGRLSNDDLGTPSGEVRIDNAAAALSIGRGRLPDRVFFDVSKVLRSFRLPEAGTSALTERLKRRIAGHLNVEAFAKQKLIESIALCSVAFPGARIHVCVKDGAPWQELLPLVVKECREYYGVRVDVNLGSSTSKPLT